MSEMVYSTQRVKNLGGRKIQNPVHFTTPEPGVTTVYVQSGHSKVSDAYSRLGVKVHPLSDLNKGAASASATEKKEK